MRPWHETLPGMPGYGLGLGSAHLRRTHCPHVPCSRQTAPEERHKTILHAIPPAHKLVLVFMHKLTMHPTKKIVSTTTVIRLYLIA